MNCPVCPGERLVISERQGIEIDYCPSCRGVWLDRGELDKIIERSAADVAPPRQGGGYGTTYDELPYGPAPYPGKGYPKRKKKSSFLSEILDF